MRCIIYWQLFAAWHLSSVELSTRHKNHRTTSYATAKSTIAISSYFYIYPRDTFAFAEPKDTQFVCTNYDYGWKIYDRQLKFAHIDDATNEEWCKNKWKKKKIMKSTQKTFLNRCHCTVTKPLRKSIKANIWGLIKFCMSLDILSWFLFYFHFSTRFVFLFIFTALLFKP